MVELNEKQQLLVDVAQITANGTFTTKDLVDYFDSPQALNSTIGSLVKKKVIVKVEKGIYSLHKDLAEDSVEEKETKKDEVKSEPKVEKTETQPKKEKKAEPKAKAKKAVKKETETKSQDNSELVEKVKSVADSINIDVKDVDTGKTFVAHRFERNKLKIRSVETVTSKGLIRLYTGKSGVQSDLHEKLVKAGVEVVDKPSYKHYVFSVDIADKVVELINS